MGELKVILFMHKVTRNSKTVAILAPHQKAADALKIKERMALQRQSVRQIVAQVTNIDPT